MGRKSRSLDDVELPPWRFIVFSDLHYGTKTMERALQALAGVREYALHYGAQVVFTGDFWDTRGVLSVRQVSALLDEFHRWRDARIQAVIIPGNHDQVSTDGIVHGARIFEPFPNITVATTRVLWPERKIAFIPWREDPEEQAGQFELKGKGWTIFAHAEIAGATTNHGHKAPGRVSLAQIKKHARACYLGHYHLRQQIGDRTWYIGTPYEIDFREMGNATGCALITAEQIEPHWLAFPDFPRHHRVTYRVPFDLSAIGAQDIVEVYASPDDLKTDEFRSFVAESVVAEDTRPLPLKADDIATAEPVFALSLDAAIDAYVDELGAEPTDHLKDLARAVLAEIPEARAIHGLSPRVDVLSVTARDFCALRGDVQLDLDKQGLVMLRGPVGIGKTALADIITWVLYDRTSPRKAGAHGATFRGDEVINDQADDCEGAVRLRLLDGTELLVTRKKERGKGSSKAHVQGLEAPDGISDTTRLIEHVVGMDYGMWRTCVSLGQGAVGNFVTDADKNRKGLLSAAFGLEACPAAQKLVRSRLKPLLIQQDKLTLDLTSEERHVATLRETDYTSQIALWEEQRDVTRKAAQDRGEDAKTQLAHITTQLEAEPSWLELRGKHQGRLDEVLRELSAMTHGTAVLAKEREMGAVEAERKLAERDLALLKPEARRLEIEFQKRQGVPCPTCGQPMPVGEAEKMVAGKHKECERMERAIRSFSSKLANLQNEVNNLKSGDTSRKDAIEAAIAESRAALAKCGEALTAFSRLRSNLDTAQAVLTESRALYLAQGAMVNPFEAKQTEIAGKIEESQTRLDEMREALDVAVDQIELLGFWDEGFGAKGLPVLVLRTALYELETYANHFLGQLLRGTVWVQLVMAGDDLKILFFENKDGVVRERRYEQLSGGQRRCAELAFAPFALSEMVFNRCGVRVPLMVIDELTTHLGAEEKPLVCDILRGLDRDTILVIDHDAAVQGQFDTVLEVGTAATGVTVRRVTA